MMDQPRPELSGHWYVTRVEDTTSIIGVTPMRVKRVYIMFDGGAETSFDVPVASYTPQEVFNQATKLAAIHYAVISLEGNVGPPPT